MQCDPLSMSMFQGLPLTKKPESIIKANDATPHDRPASNPSVTPNQDKSRKKENDELFDFNQNMEQTFIDLESDKDFDEEIAINPVKF